MNSFKKIFSFLFGGEKKGTQKTGGDNSGSEMDHMDISQLAAFTEGKNLTAKLSQNLSLIRKIYGNSFGLQIREFRVGPGDNEAAMVFIEGMVDSASLEEKYKILLVGITNKKEVPTKAQPLFDFIRDKLIACSEVRDVTRVDEMFDQLLSGDTTLLLEGVDRALVFGTKGFKTRSIMESESETSIRGSRESFIESLTDNLSLIRRRIKVPQLWVELYRVGSLTRTQVALVYIKGLVGEEILEEFRTRISSIDTDSIIESGQLETFIEDNPYTFFPLLLRTERVDRTAAALLEGQAAVLTDGSSFALLAPATFFNMLNAPEDYFEKFPIGSFLRILRYTAFLMSIFLPSIYVAVINFHPELVPTQLLLRVAATREGIPFPVIVEMALMEATFEVLREAGIRLPAAIGPAISIVGALILGDAAIRAGIVSPPVVIVVALTAIASFAVPNFALGISGRMLRFGLLALGGIFGMFGIQIGAFLLIAHLCSLRSFGIPYMAPAAPMIVRDMKDFLVRIPNWAASTRPRLTGFREPVRQSQRQARRYFKLPFPRKKGGEENGS